MNTFIVGRGTLRSLQLRDAVEALVDFFSISGEPIVTLDGLSLPDSFEALLRVALGVNIDLAITFTELAEPGRFDVTLDVRDTVAVADFDVSLGLISIFVYGASELTLLDETLTPWRYDVFDGTATKRSGRLDVDGPAETVSSFGPSRPMKMTPEELYADGMDHKPMTPARAAQVAKTIAEVIAKRNDPQAPPGWRGGGKDGSAP